MQIKMYTPLNSYFATQPFVFDFIMQLRGEVFRELENRRTQRVVFQNQPYFVKQHFGVGWREIIKNLLQLRLPILSAKNEWRALLRLQRLQIGVPSVEAYGVRGINPAKRQSFLITRALPAHVSLDDLTKNWQTVPPSFSDKLKLLKEVARIARIMHQHGMNHRDFYLCHFLWCESQAKMYLIDLHRAQIRKHVPVRWLIKDLAGLYFSSKNIGLTKRDILRFMQEYRKKPLADILNQEANFWHKVEIRGNQLYRKHA